MIKSKPHDDLVRQLISDNPNLAVPLYLINSYLYYKQDAAIIEDETFDWIISILEEKWDQIQHIHKPLLDKNFLKSGFHITYPNRVPYAATAFVSHYDRHGRQDAP